MTEKHTFSDLDAHFLDVMNGVYLEHPYEVPEIEIARKRLYQLNRQIEDGEFIGDEAITRELGEVDSELMSYNLINARMVIHGGKLIPIERTSRDNPLLIRWTGESALEISKPIYATFLGAALAENSGRDRDRRSEFLVRINNHEPQMYIMDADTVSAEMEEMTLGTAEKLLAETTPELFANLKVLERNHIDDAATFLLGLKSLDSTALIAPDEPRLHDAFNTYMRHSVHFDKNLGYIIVAQGERLAVTLRSTYMYNKGTYDGICVSMTRHGAATSDNETYIISLRELDDIVSIRRLLAIPRFEAKEA